jgi:3-oxoacyl-[acyl-carrier protein] reductase
LPIQATAYQCNIADYQQTTDTFKKIVAAFGTIDILVNNAGITQDKLVMSMKPEDFDKVIDVNLKGAFYAIKQVYPLFVKKKSGKIINISSIAGLIGNAGQANYAASKAGVVGLTKTVARELASRGVCCNAIAPGFIKTDMTEKFAKNETVIGNIPMKRIG